MELKGAIDKLERFVNLYPSDSDSKDKEILNYELGQLKGIYSKDSFADKYAVISGVDFSTRWSSKGTSLNEDDIARAKALRDSYKGIVNTLKKDFYGLSLSDIFDDILYVRNQAIALIEFAKEYSRVLLEEKKKRNIYDFNDVEHMALRILRNEESKEHEKRPVAI